MNYTALLALILGAIVFFVALVQLGRRSPASRWRWLLVFAVLSIPSLWFATYYLHVLPESEWLYRVRAVKGSEFLVVFPGAAGGVLASLLPRLLLGLPLFGYLLVGAIPYVKPILYPLADADLKEQWSGEACLQSTGSTCGPACVATILRRLGVETSERTVAGAAYTSTGGTEAWYLARYVRAAPVEHGVFVHIYIREGFNPELGLPAMIGVRVGGAGHFIAVLEKNGDQITFADPMHGEETLSLEQFRQRHVFTGFHMSVIED